jgi:hypothetical protein
MGGPRYESNNLSSAAVLRLQPILRLWRFTFLNDFLKFSFNFYKKYFESIVVPEIFGPNLEKVIWKYRELHIGVLTLFLMK